METGPRWVVAAVNMVVREGQEITSVCWKRARARGWLGVGVLEEVVVVSVWDGYWAMRAEASGRRVRSAKRTLQPWERRREENARPMPV